MIRHVLITERAQAEADAAHDWWAEHRSLEQAARWYEKFLKAARSLERDPQRFVLAAENQRFPYEIRELNFGVGRKVTHRLVYAIRSHDVVVLRLRHLSQQAIEPE